jgi:hypothetical protein
MKSRDTKVLTMLDKASDSITSVTSSFETGGSGKCKSIGPIGRWRVR